MRDLKDFLDDYTTFDYSDIENMYEAFLNEVYPDGVECCGEYLGESGYVLKKESPTTFRCGVADWSSEEFTEYEGDYYKKEDYDSAFDEYDSQEEEEEEL